eukprot:2309621-Alexandrium_andersonii.AAC.1
MWPRPAGLGCDGRARNGQHNAAPQTPRSQRLRPRTVSRGVGIRLAGKLQNALLTERGAADPLQNSSRLGLVL